MSDRFDYFVILAGMRTGSNLLEEHINNFAGAHCYGEVFNPAFVGHANQRELFGMSPADVAQRPNSMISHLKKNTKGIAGFRLFHDHNPQILTQCLEDQRCAKILLTRNALDSYVSLGIARKTNQWRLSDPKKRKQAQAEFDLAEFSEFLEQTRRFNRNVVNSTQQTGQTLFHISYPDLQNDALIMGIGRFLGIDEPAILKNPKTKRQNPQKLEQKVANFDEMRSSLESLDLYHLFDDLQEEPTRGPMVPNFIASVEPALLYMPMLCGPDQSVQDWMKRVSNENELVTGMSQKLLRKWKRENAKHRSFTIVRHPLIRAFSSFYEVVERGKNADSQGLRDILASNYQCDLEQHSDISKFDDDALGQCFLGFLGFLKETLGGSSAMPIEARWSSQSALLEGMASFAAPDMIIREECASSDLEYLAGALGIESVPAFETEPSIGRLFEIQTDEMQKVAKSTYQRDYMQFGFGKVPNKI